MVEMIFVLPRMSGDGGTVFYIPPRCGVIARHSAAGNG